jgi:circadian clock protein KaiB
MMSTNLQPRPSNQYRVFERGMDRRVSEKYLLRLYVTGSTPRSLRAVRNIRDMCENCLDGRYELEVIDIYQQPEQARTDQIVVTPTLVRQMPGPGRRLVGDMSARERILISLDIVPDLDAEKSGRES